MAVVNSCQFAVLGYLINGLVGAKIGAALGILFTSVNEVRTGELAQAKYALAQTVNVFRNNKNDYTYGMYEKDLVHSELAEFYPSPSPLCG